MEVLIPTISQAISKINFHEIFCQIVICVFSYGSPSYYSPPSSSNNWEDDYADEDDDYYDETTVAPPNNPWSGITQPPIWNNNYNNDEDTYTYGDIKYSSNNDQTNDNVYNKNSW